jgi:hypothetical protein
MPHKGNKCSSSSSSEKCEGSCPPKCEFNICDGEPIPTITCKVKDAVVGIHSEFLFTNLGTDSLTPPSYSNGTLVAHYLHGNGFFIKGHYIIVPSHLVLIPPSLSKIANRYPFVSDSVPAPNGLVQNQMVKASQIIVDVYNVNGTGKGYAYRAQLIGVDGAGDIAVLRIHRKDPFNKCNPCIEKCHPFLSFGKSRKYPNGDDVYAVGNFSTHWHADAEVEEVTDVPYTGNPVLVQGLMAYNQFMDFEGWSQAEMVLVTVPAFNRRAGMPILDKFGKVLAMQTTNTIARNSLVPFTGDGYVGGPSEFFMRRIIKVIISGPKSKLGYYSEGVLDNCGGSFLRYKKAFAGIVWKAITGSNYSRFTSDGTNGVTGTYYVPVGNTSPPRNECNCDEFGNCGFFDGPKCKELIGVRVVGLVGATGPNYVNLPGAGATGVTGSCGLVNSPFIGVLAPDDIITYLDNCPLGNLGNQIVPALFTSNLGSGENVKVTYKKASQDYDEQHITCQQLPGMPYLYDYPWYKINDFPVLNAFGGPVGIPQLPNLLFRAAF